MSVQEQRDNLRIFSAAIGGAVLGMLLTLLVLAVLNGGTLNFRLASHWEANGAKDYLLPMVTSLEQKVEELETRLVVLEAGN